MLIVRNAAIWPTKLPPSMLRVCAFLNMVIYSVRVTKLVKSLPHAKLIYNFESIIYEKMRKNNVQHY